MKGEIANGDKEDWTLTDPADQLHNYTLSCHGPANLKCQVVPEHLTVQLRLQREVR